MRLKTWPVAAFGLGSLAAADRGVDAGVLAQGAGHLHPARPLNTHHHNVDAKLRRLRSDVNLSGIFVRDYLLDIARERAPEYRQRLAEFRGPTWRRSPSSRPSSRDTTIRFAACRRSSTTTGRPSIRSSTGRRPRRSFGAPAFCGSEVVPRREAVLTIAQEIEELNNANLAEQRAEVTRRHAAFRRRPRPPAVAQPPARPGRRAHRGLPAARARAAIRGAADDRRRGRAPDARALAAAGRHAGGRAQEPVA